MNLVLCGSPLPSSQSATQKYDPELPFGLGILDQTFRATQAAKGIHRPSYPWLFLFKIMLALALGIDSFNDIPFPRSSIDLCRTCVNNFTKLQSQWCEGSLSRVKLNPGKDRMAKNQGSSRHPWWPETFDSHPWRTRLASMVSKLSKPTKMRPFELVSQVESLHNTVHLGMK